MYELRPRRGSNGDIARPGVVAQYETCPSISTPRADPATVDRVPTALQGPRMARDRQQSQAPIQHARPLPEFGPAGGARAPRRWVVPSTKRSCSSTGAISSGSRPVPRPRLTFDDVSSCSGDEACSQQVEVGASIHLALEGLQLVDLAFRLSVGPRLAKGCQNRMLVGGQTTGVGCEKGCLRPHSAGHAMRLMHATRLPMIGHSAMALG